MRSVMLFLFFSFAFLAQALVRALRFHHRITVAPLVVVLFGYFTVVPFLRFTLPSCEHLEHFHVLFAVLVQTNNTGSPSTSAILIPYRSSSANKVCITSMSCTVVAKISCNKDRYKQTEHCEVRLYRNYQIKAID